MQFREYRGQHCIIIIKLMERLKIIPTTKKIYAMVVEALIITTMAILQYINVSN